MSMTDIFCDKAFDAISKSISEEQQRYNKQANKEKFSLTILKGENIGFGNSRCFMQYLGDTMAGWGIKSMK